MKNIFIYYKSLYVLLHFFPLEAATFIWSKQQGWNNGLDKQADVLQ